ncbi:MobF family relaxase [Saccharothrix variisporea]|uniref:Conjugative relaxase-like TrwC/TraI family protein n=1 Tax=Saccharothrix variisporea TaxID=543527 RepID=A0A495X4X6_9PSEU|nr:MobF family relaxase [Saccharothrix variisporea]RKT69361.1 conjugative relaxase-like TrwC/TraI family protein [Saccharothrix variisporea]
MMALKVLHAGDGYQYLMRQVATGDILRQGRDPLTAYYHQEGNPPGEWIGAGTTDLGIHGEVREDQMQALFGERLHPEANILIAAALAQGKSFKEAAAGVRLGRKLAQYDNTVPLLTELRAAYDRFEHDHQRRPSIQERRDIKENVAAALLSLQDPARTWSDTEIRTYITNELGRARQPVSGFDLVFSQPTKTADILWALGDHHTRTALEAAHHEAVRTAITYLESEAAFSRTGKAGIAQIETTGLVATAFTHRESRAGDPNLHTHVAVANTVHCTDGRWRTLDSRQLHHVAVSASEVYNAAWERGVTRRLDVRFETRPRGPGKRPVRDIAGIPEEWITGFSQRRSQVEHVYNQLVAQYVRTHDTSPPRTVQLKLAQQAAVTDRPDKGALKPLHQLLADWRDRAHQMRPDLDIQAVTTAAVHNTPGPPTPAHLDLAALAIQVVDAVSEYRATWTIYHVRAEAERQLRGIRFTDEHHHDTTVDTLTQQALTRHCVRLDPEPEPTPQLLSLSTGESVFHRHGQTRYTSPAILDAEQRLLDAARTPRGPTVPTKTLDKVLRSLQRTRTPSRHRITLNAGQRELVRWFVSSGRALALAIGPPGSGKSTAMKAVARAWARTGGRVIGLAPSAAAAGVLGDVLDVPADTLHRLVYSYDRGLPVDVRRGDMLLVDEAGMAGTRMLDRITTLAEQRGAVVRLVGDYRQLTAVEAGGALRLLHHDTGGAQLTDLLRFTNPEEAQAILHIRVGDHRAITWYTDHNRLHGGPQAAILDQLFTAWRTDRDNGHTTIMSADTNDIVAELSARAQTELRATGTVEPTGILLRDGNLAGRGDTIVTRLNKRTLRPRLHDHVKNGDLWTVLRRNPDGSLKVRHQKHRGTITLPAHYVKHHVELGYAATIHRTQGLTVDISRATLSPGATRELATVALSRGTDQNHLYLDTTQLLTPDEPATLPGDLYYRHRQTQATQGALAAILNREGAELSATETHREAQEAPHRLDVQVPEYEHALAVYHGIDHETQAEDWVTEALPDLADHILTDEAWPALRAALHEAHDTGHNPSTLLRQRTHERELHTANNITRVLHHRITTYLDDNPPNDFTFTDTPAHTWLPPWIPPPPPEDQPTPDTAHAELRTWLHTKAQHISKRIDQLTDQALNTRPQWLTRLMPPPERSAEHEHWRDLVKHITAYRERWNIPDTEPTPLGCEGRGIQKRAHRWLHRRLLAITRHDGTSVQGEHDLAAMRTRAFRVRREAAKAARQPQPPMIAPSEGPRAQDPKTRPNLTP